MGWGQFPILDHGFHIDLENSIARTLDSIVFFDQVDCHDVDHEFDSLS